MKSEHTMDGLARAGTKRVAAILFLSILAFSLASRAALAFGFDLFPLHLPPICCHPLPKPPTPVAPKPVDLAVDCIVVLPSKLIVGMGGDQSLPAGVAIGDAVRVHASRDCVEYNVPGDTSVTDATIRLTGRTVVSDAKPGQFKFYVIGRGQ